MKKNQIITVILVLVLILSLVIAITSCNSRMNADTEPTETANETVETEKEISEVETTDAASTEIEETEETKYSVSSAIDHEAMLLAQIEKRVKREKVTPASYQKVQEDAPTPSEETPAASSPAPQEPSQESAPAPAQPAQPPEPVHTHSYSTGKSATCTENGYTVCSCGATQTIPAYGHNYSGGSCTNCGASDPNWVPPHEHNYQVAGSKFVCKRCGHTTYNDTDKQNHALECESGWWQYVIYRCECGDELVQ